MMIVGTNTGGERVKSETNKMQCSHTTWYFIRDSEIESEKWPRAIKLIGFQPMCAKLCAGLFFS